MSLSTACGAIWSDQLPIREVLFRDNAFCKGFKSFVLSDEERGWKSSPNANNPLALDGGRGDNLDGDEGTCGRNC